MGQLITTTLRVIAPPRRSVGHLARWAARDCTPGSAVLDIGAGCNRSGSLKALARRSPYLVGVDPDDGINENPFLDERHQMSVEEFSVRNPSRFDVALAVYVLEHVGDPAAFTAACAMVLKPGASLFGVTPNVGHYFGATTWAASRLGCEERVLTWLRGDHGHDHHFHAEYRLNSIRTISRQLDNAGFRAVDFRCYDATDRYRWYMPSGLKWFPAVYTRVAYAVGSPSLMGHLSFRAVR
jgi:2-polyprenyl-6-hydroxyphenyl methylase/3-demethylubiquinone-9 3-methyltransferase